MLPEVNVIFFFQYAFKYLLINAANITQENIIDSHAAWTEGNVVTSLQIKECKTHLLFVSDLKMDENLCYNKKSTKEPGVSHSHVFCVKLRALWSPPAGWLQYRSKTTTTTVFRMRR